MVVNLVFRWVTIVSVCGECRGYCAGSAVVGLGGDFRFCLVFPSSDTGVVPIPCRTLILALTCQNQRPARWGTKNCSIFDEIRAKNEKIEFLTKDRTIFSPSPNGLKSASRKVEGPHLHQNLENEAKTKIGPQPNYGTEQAKQHIQNT